MEKGLDHRTEKMVAQRIQAVNRVYELRYVRCGRLNCHTCFNRGVSYCGPPGHGPYWYLCATRKGRTVQIYIGKILDTSKYMTPEGDIDWAAYRYRTKKEATP